jgi:hypothetical protein
MSVNRKRVTKMETSLTPTAAVLLWLKEAQSYGSLQQYATEVRERLSEPGSKFPRSIVEERITQAVRDALKGRPHDEIDRAVRDAAREGDFLFVLTHDLNDLVRLNQRVNTLQAGLLAEQIRHLLEQDAVSNEMERLFWFFAFGTAYPMDTETAAAINACEKYDVTIDEEETGLSEEIESWVFNHFVTHGKTALPENAGLPDDLYRLIQVGHREPEDDGRPDAWMLLKRPPEADILRAFNGNRDAYNAFRAGDDFQHGLADVRDEEFQQVADRVHTALTELVAAGAVVKGILVTVDTAVTEAFYCTPLVDGEWIDRTIVELAELGWFLEQAGFRVEGSTDPDPIRWSVVLAPTGDDEATFDQIAAVRDQVRAHVATFTGRTTQIDGRDYLSFADYLSWKSRKATDDFPRAEGIVIASWNAWVDAHGGDGVAELAGVKVFTIDRQEHQIIALDDRRAFTEQQNRRAQIDRLRDWIISKREVEGPEFVRDRVFGRAAGHVLPFDRVSYKTKIAEWRSRVLGYAGEVLRTEAAIRIIERKYFDGHVVLWPDIAADLQRQIEMLQSIIDVYNETVAFRLARYEGRELLTDEIPRADDDRTPLFRAGFRIDLDEVRRLIQPLIATTVQEIVTAAKSNMLWTRGDHHAALNFDRHGRQERPRT